MLSRVVCASVRNSALKNGSFTQEQKRNLRRLASTSSSTPASLLPNVNISISPGVTITPKRGPSAYAIFVHDKMKSMTGVKAPDAIKPIVAQWQKLNQDEKRAYEMESERIQKQLEEAFFSMSSEEFREAVTKEMQRLQNKRVTALRRQQKQLKESYVYPGAGGDYFKLQAVAKDHSSEMAKVGKNVTDRGRKMGELWRELPDEEKKEYEKREKAARSKYKKDIAAWESKMKKQGLAKVVEMVNLRLKKHLHSGSGKKIVYRTKTKVLGSKISAAKRKSPIRRKKAV